MNAEEKVVELINILETIVIIPNETASSSRAVKEMVKLATEALELAYAEMPNICT